MSCLLSWLYPGGRLPVAVVLVLGFSNIFADALSMGVGEYLSSKVRSRQQHTALDVLYGWIFAAGGRLYVEALSFVRPRASRGGRSVFVLRL